MMREVHLRSLHTVRSHGVTLARTHMHDWLILALLVMIEVVLNVIDPFYRFVGKDMMTDLKYPLKGDTIPLWAIPFYDQLGNAVCHGDKSMIKKGHKSFPSSHTSWSFACLGFLSLYLSGKIKAFDRRGHVSKLCIVLLPLLVASLVGISRVDDYMHHWEDVFAGGLIGWGPYAFFRVLEESGASTQPANTMDTQNVQTSEFHIENQQDERNGNTFMGISMAGDSSSNVQHLELGRR